MSVGLSMMVVESGRAEGAAVMAREQTIVWNGGGT